ncbi:predicted protein [Histoplasma mississippiense (nom. inval.)]|uniref:predicted protein n=1 Tax=Ajellomyces capsulatus (strain NAm1 / WU24) TaxID=2059318 RepID=UPI000157CF43|nr:predicted protein [Histoplasma mississippiense (nom. inval.)]EDN10956.1 predicted protein [Histoplasma mississippiense (nom. inval.)]
MTKSLKKHAGLPHPSKWPCFSTDVVFPSESVDGVVTEEGRILVRYQAPMGHPDRDAIKELEIPREPTDLQGLRVLEVDMYNSRTQAYEMDKKYSDWFSEWFGFEVLLVYLGGNRRPVLGNVPPNAAAKRAVAGASQPALKNAGGGWISNIAKSLLYLGSTTPSAKREGDETDEWITFADMAPYLVVSETSLEEEAYEEDFWGEITVQTDVNLILTANCGRCVSINVDYDTGAPGSGEAGTMLKKLMKDRRVDKGNKYSPVFGRYGFIDKGADGLHIEVGDDVVVSRRNKERTTFFWPM